MGVKVREYRQKLSMTQKDLADKSKVSRVTISALENGTLTNVTISTLMKIADALGATVEEIFFAKDV